MTAAYIAATVQVAAGATAARTAATASLSAAIASNKTRVIISQF